MDLEIMFNNIDSKSIYPILKIFNFDSKKIIRSLFYKDGIETSFNDVLNFDHYFNDSKENDGITGSIVLSDLFIGTEVKDVVVLIYFYENIGDLTIFFGVDNGIEFLKENKNKIKLFLLNEVNNIFNMIDFSAIFFGLEPAIDTDMTIFKLNRKNFKSI